MFLRKAAASRDSRASVICCLRASISAASIASGSSNGVLATRSATTASRAALSWSTRAMRCTASARSARISSTVSNSEIIWANSSSTSGSVSVCTFSTVTVTSAFSPLAGPPTSSALNSALSPAFSPVTASSRPSIMPPEPTL